MAQTALIQVRVDDELKYAADELFSDLGFDTSTAITIFLKQAIKRQGLPFAVQKHSPNSETIDAMKDVDAKHNLTGPFNNVDDLMTSLLEDINV